MGGVIDSIIDTITDIIDAIVDLVRDVWNDIVVPILEEIFSWFGIEDETVVEVQKVSVAVLADDPPEYIKKAFIKTVMGMSGNGQGFFSNYVQQFYKNKAELQTYYRYAENGPFVYELPNMSIRGTNIDMDAVQTAVNTDLAGDYPVLTVDAMYPPAEIYFRHDLQSAPYNYLPYADTLTKTAANTVAYSDWSFASVDFNFTSGEYDILVQRTAEITTFWITCDDSVQAGGSGTITVHCNRAVPSGESITVDLTYGLFPQNGIDYSAPTSVTLNAGDTSASVTIDSVTVSNHVQISIEIDSVNNTGEFEHTEVFLANSITYMDLIPSGEAALTVPYVAIGEGNTATIEVQLNQATTGSFTVDYAAIQGGGTALAGSDFDAVTGTLTFTGNAGEVQSFNVATYNDTFEESADSFEISLSNVSDASVNIATNGRVRIVDGSTTIPGASTGIVTEIISRPNYVTERYMVITYHEASAPDTEWFYWLYRLADETYPDIKPESSQISNLDMLPIAILRKNKQFINQDQDIDNDLFEPFGKSTEVYRTTRNLLRRLNLNLEDVISSVGENPDIDLIDDCYVNFAIDPADNNKVLSKLFWMHWYEIIVTHAIESNTEEYSAVFEEQDVNNGMAWSYHDYTPGVPLIGSEDQAILDLEVGEHWHILVDEHLFIYRKASSNTVDVINVRNLSGMSAVAYDGFHNVAFTKAGDGNFTFPISWHILKQLRGPEIHEIFPYIFRLDMYAIQTIELAWYQTDAFKKLFEIIVLIVTIWTLGTATNWLAALGQVLFNYAVIEIVIFVAELTGNEEVAAVVGTIAAITLGSASGINFDMTTAEGLTNAVTTFSSSLGAAQSWELEQLQSDLDDLIEDYERQQERLEEQDVYTAQIGGLEYLSLTTPDTQLYLGRDIQYNFDLLYDYDSLISNYYDAMLSSSPK